MPLSLSRASAGTLLIGSGLLVCAAATAAFASPSAVAHLASLWASHRHAPVSAGWTDAIGRALIDLFLAGAALTTVGLAIRYRAEEILRRSSVRIAAAAALTGLVQLLVAWFRQSFVYGGRRIWFLDDDAMISMRYAANLAAGKGLVWNPGEHVEGYTNFLWTSLMAAVHALGIGREQAALVILLVNVALSVILLAAVNRLARRLGTTDAVAFSALVLCALSRDIVSWSSSGLETIALAVLVTLALPGLLDHKPRMPDQSLAVAALALLPLVRSDAIVLSVLLILVAVVAGAGNRTVTTYALAALVPAVAHLAFRIQYYGSWLPNTAYLKVTGSDHRLSRGLLYLAGFALSYAAVLMAGAAALVRLPARSRTGLAVLSGGYIAYVIYVGGDAFDGFRFLVPLLPLFFVLAATGVRSWASPGWTRAALSVALVATTPLLLPNRWMHAAPAFATALAPSYGDTGNVEIGLWLQDHAAKDASVADYWAGSVFYFSERRGVDLLGKMDPVIARMPSRCPTGLPGHTKYDFAHSLGALRPDYVVAGFKLQGDGRLSGPSGESIPPDGTADPCAIFAALAGDEVFRRAYRPNVAANGFWRTIFQRRVP